VKPGSPSWLRPASSGLLAQAGWFRPGSGLLAQACWLRPGSGRLAQAC